MKGAYFVSLVLALFFFSHIHTTSIVYNFRIAQITKQPILERSGESGYTLVALAFDQYRKKYNDVRQNFIGGFGSYIFNFGSAYLRVDGALAHIHEVFHKETTFSGTETDDILFTCGKNLITHEKMVLTLSGLFGIPTHKLQRLQHIDFGYSLIGLGGQLDGLYQCSDKESVVYGFRQLYFIPRMGRNTAGNSYKFTLGNVSDLLVAYKNNWNTHHGVEFGYTARFRYGAWISPHLDDIVQKANYIRSNLYGVYKYKFRINNVAHRLLLNFSYGHDHAPKTFGNRYILTLWASWNGSF